MQGMIQNRKSGVLMPVFSLPSAEGIGTLGENAYRFVDWLQKSGATIWQVLPLLPTGYGDSPYQSCASDALNHYFIDLQTLVKEGLLENEDLAIDWGEERKIDYGKLFEKKVSVLKKAYFNFDKTDKAWKAFLRKGKYRDYATFMTLKTTYSYAPWTEWKDCYKNREKAALAGFEKEHAEEIGFWQFTQFVFLKQWRNLKTYANENGIEIMGDMPIYLSFDSVETWTSREKLFILGKDGNPSLRAGVPPDAFSEDGQLWGNPVYNWEKMRKNGYRWWRNRIKYAFEFFDIVRIDHFRGFDRFYVIPEGSQSAKNGEWLQGPSAALFKTLKDKEIVAEDLGLIDDGVRAMMKATGYPGMKVLSFGWNGDPESEHKASNFKRNVCAYTGTHDNSPLLVIVSELLSEEKRQYFLPEFNLENEKLGLPIVEKDVDEETVCDTMIEQLFASEANTVIIPMQDLLHMGEESRINRPSALSSENWTFRFISQDFTSEAAERFKSLAKKYFR